MMICSTRCHDVRFFLDVKRFVSFNCALKRFKEFFDRYEVGNNSAAGDRRGTRVCDSQNDQAQTKVRFRRKGITWAQGDPAEPRRAEPSTEQRQRLPLELIILRMHTLVPRLSPAGRVISDFISIKELLKAFQSAIKAHKSLYIKGKILHRDISSNNIIITDQKTLEAMTACW